MKFPHHLSIAANTITTGHQNGGHVTELKGSGIYGGPKAHAMQ